MYVLVLPVSGGGFVNQLGILQHLCEVNFKPDLTLASSGGNVSAYIAAAANWKWASIERISREMTQELFVKNWSSMSTMSFVIGFFKGNAYDKGIGVKNFLNKYFTETTITNYEIWTGTYNQERQKSSIFCNRSKENSIIDTSVINYELIQSTEASYADGNIDRIALAGIASASIPALVPEQLIDGEYHSDGGIGSASPLMTVQESIIDYIDTNDEILHLVYVNSIDLSVTNSTECYNVVDTWKQATNNMVRSKTVCDRLLCYQMLKHKPGKIRQVDFECNYNNLKSIQRFRILTKCSLLEIYPNNPKVVKLSKFNGEDIVKCIKSTYGKCTCRFWWVQNDKYNDDINKIINSLENSLSMTSESCSKSK
jgi:hypothetical protein